MNDNDMIINQKDLIDGYTVNSTFLNKGIPVSCKVETLFEGKNIPTGLLFLNTDTISEPVNNIEKVIEPSTYNKIIEQFSNVEYDPSEMNSVTNVETESIETIEPETIEPEILESIEPEILEPETVETVEPEILETVETVEPELDETVDKQIAQKKKSRKIKIKTRNNKKNKKGTYKKRILQTKRLNPKPRI